MDEFSFNVEIWEEEPGDFHWAVSEECDGVFTPLGWGETESFDIAAEQASEVVRDYFKKNV